jgi:hypothetical protein
MRFRLRTLLILLTVGPPLIAWGPNWWSESPGLFWKIYFAVSWSLVLFALWSIGE